MKNYIIKRLLHTCIVLIGISVVVFFIVHLSGDPALLMLPLEASVEELNAFRDKMGLNDPFWLQYWHFISNAVRGDFGTSLHQGEPALSLVLERLPATIELTVTGMLIAILIGIPAGIISAVKRNSILDTVVRTVALLGQATPVFWMAIMLILVFAVNLRILPTSGRGEFRQLILPAFALGFYSVAMIARLLRSALLEVLAQDYIRTSQAKGLAPKMVIFKHALKNSLIPVVTIIGLQTGLLLGGAVITETIFAWPGVGRLAVQAIYARDFPVIQAIVFVVASIFVFINLLVDISYTWLDPRIRYK